MRQFDVVANPAERFRQSAPYLVVVQSHYLIRIDTTVVAPLVLPEVLPPDGALGLGVEFNDQPFTLSMQQLSSMPAARIGRALGTLERYDLDIARAWERLLSGF